MAKLGQCHRGRRLADQGDPSLAFRARMGALMGYFSNRKFPTNMASMPEA